MKIEAPSDATSSSSGSYDVTPATSPPSSLIEQCHVNLGVKIGAAEIVSNPSNYLALGCIVRQEDQDRRDEISWHEVRSTAELSLEMDLAADVQSLLSNGWVRLQSSTRRVRSRLLLLIRVFVLFADVGKAQIDRDNRRLTSALMRVIAQVDVSPTTWAGHYDPDVTNHFDSYATRDQDDPSLFYLFNTLPSPNPSIMEVRDLYSRQALEDLLDYHIFPAGLKTTLYPYQRRSAGMMLQRESVPGQNLTPQLEQRIAADGTQFYYNARKLEFRRDAEYCESCRGGILAETMGYGKTIICLALILATRNHLPRIPAEYALSPVRSTVGSLTEMALSAVNRHSVQWKVELDRTRRCTDENSCGGELEVCAEKLRANPPSYEIPTQPYRWNRTTSLPPPRHLTLTSTTLVVVPQNLCKQWQTEIMKHVEDGFLNILVMDDRRKPLPCPQVLCEYDIILFTRSRFDLESRDGEDPDGRRIVKASARCRCQCIGATRIRECDCLREDMLYQSPLKQLHFKRLIVDEGHFFSSNTSNTTMVANRLVTADSKWVVSGTPAKDLLGVEADVATLSGQSSNRSSVLEQGRSFAQKQDSGGAIDSLGSIISNYLQAAPWSSPATAWKDYIFRHEDPRRHTYSGFASSLRRTLESIVIKTRPEDVERDIELPPLRYSIVRLEPCFWDKLTANLFTLVLTANAITSERTDEDYLFHKKSAKSRYQLVSNLRQSTFFWTGFTQADILASIENSTKYLRKEGTACTEDDRKLMLESLACTDPILASKGWLSLSRSHEFGVYVEGWPSESAEHWSFDATTSPMLIGVSQLLQAQQFVDQRAHEADPGDGLAGEGIKALATLRSAVNGDAAISTVETESQSKRDIVLNKAGLPQSTINGEPLLRRRDSASGKKASPKKMLPKRPKCRVSKVNKAEEDEMLEMPNEISAEKSTDHVTTTSISPDSAYGRAKIVGTTSAKMSYLISQILEHQKDEKILVFYSGDNIAYYIAQVLDLLDVKHEIYAKSLQNRLKSEYIVEFDQGTDTRVLLMDVGQAAFGLNLSTASRVYFVNPVCRPNVEAQAIKRAHRIGQSRPVVVETLVLRGSIEEEMFERSRRMTADEHRDAKTLEDDTGIKNIIQSARLLPLSSDECSGMAQIALIEKPVQLWKGSSSNGRRKRKRDHEGATNLKNKKATKPRTTATSCSGTDVDTTANSRAVDGDVWSKHANNGSFHGSAARH